jgi:hypothetical protein
VVNCHYKRLRCLQAINRSSTCRLLDGIGHVSEQQADPTTERIPQLHLSFNCPHNLYVNFQQGVYTSLKISPPTQQKGTQLLKGTFGSAWVEQIFCAPALGAKTAPAPHITVKKRSSMCPRLVGLHPLRC